MTKVTDLEASFEQYKKSYKPAENNRQPAAAATTIPPPLHTQPLQSYPTMLLQHPNTTTTSLPPTFALPQPLQQPGPTLPSSTAYTSFPSFPGLPFDSQGFPIPYGSNGEFFGPFQTGEHSSYNSRLPVSTEGMFQNFSDVSLVNAGRFFPAPNQTIPPPLVHGNERGWVPGIDYRLRKLKMPLFNGDNGETQGCDDVPRGSSSVLVSMDSQQGTIQELGRFKAANASSFSILASGKGVTPKAANRTGGDSSRPSAVVTRGGGAPFKRMTDSEFADKRAKGLCYRCDGQYCPGHRCPEKALQVLLVNDEEE
ncbi:hypothetical protein Tco_0702907 [Tanacetum coccineum]|uniref:Uncharacterized protein n=1 Tax=Tanacetum coccineum TaxID=301880 RepID=A0ABQ4XYV8_9ASTR